MNYYVLASGSKGNCTIIDINGKLLLIDVGISVPELEEKLTLLGYNIEDIAAILITHDHNDHIRSINHFENNLIYGGSIVYNIREENKLEVFKKYHILDTIVTPLPLSHDSGTCFGYRIEFNNEILIYITDTGYVSSKIAPYIIGATHYIFESNHNVKMLMNTKRPMFLKQRIISDVGHLSNEDSAFVLSKLITKDTKSVILAHVSEQANTKETVLETFYKICAKNNVDLSKISVQVADQHKITSLNLINV